jgi:hypothetical protein
VQEGWSAILVVLLLLGSAVLFVRLRQGAATSDDERGLPRALLGAEVAYAERTFRSVGTRLVARLDRAYRVEGELRLMELKTRARNVVYMSDIVEMSVQRIAVQDETGEAVSIDAWVVVQNSDTGSRRPHKVRLLGRDEIVRLAERYRDVAGGRIAAPNPARSPSQCRQCSHCHRCAATFRDRGHRAPQ